MSPVCQITAPIFDKVTIKLDRSIYSGKKFVIKTVNLNGDNIYIQSAKLNGENINRSFLTHKEIINGGELVYVMGNKPNKKWGI